MYGAFGPTAQRLAVSALQHGLGDSLERIGMDRGRLVRAAEMTFASEQLSPREVGALAYVQGLTGSEAAFLAFGSGREVRTRPSSDRIARLGTARPAWWAEPVTRVGDLGDGMTQRLIGASIGIDLGRMASSDPLPVPADARFAALSKLVLGDHWDLSVGIRDQEWISTLNTGHREISDQFITFLTKDELLDAEEEQDLYHQVPVASVPALLAPQTFGAGVGVVLAAGKEWLQMFIHVVKGKGLRVHVCHLDERWSISGRNKRFGIDGLFFEVASLAEVGTKLQEMAPDAASWRAVSLRFPSGVVAASANNEVVRRLA